MDKPAKTIEVKVERTIPASPQELFDGWLNPKVPGTPWNAAEKFTLEAKVEGLFFWAPRGTSHYGRFTQLDRPGLIQHTWVSPNTLGQESVVTVTFKKVGDETRMTLVHSGLPDCEPARGHEKGWNYFLGIYGEQFGKGSRQEYRWEEAHPRSEGPKP
ncbi:MAG TPA: SRPBCC domain-containing protein [bacterium]|nr:SRPBCC domain-containing protein [bacterium]